MVFPIDSLFSLTFRPVDSKTARNCSFQLRTPLFGAQPNWPMPWISQPTFRRISRQWAPSPPLCKFAIQRKQISEVSKPSRGSSLSLLTWLIRPKEYIAKFPENSDRVRLSMAQMMYNKKLYSHVIPILENITALQAYCFRITASHSF